MTAIGMAAIVLCVLAAMVIAGLDQEGVKTPEWVVGVTIVVFLLGMALTCTGLFIWAWRMLP